MGFREGAFATVWEIANQGNNFTKVRASTSRKDKKSDEYITDFSGFVSLIGKAHEKAGEIEAALESGRCRIKIGACDVSNRYAKEEQREYVNFTMFDFEMAEGSTSDSGSSEKSGGKKNTKKAPVKKTGGAKKKPAASAESDDGEGGDDGELPF